MVKIILASLIALLLSACGGNATMEPAEDYYYTSTMVVEKILKSPSTAKFSNYHTAGCECGSKALANGAYETWGWVDSQNGFGAMIRSTWRIVLVHKGTQYVPTYVEFAGEVVLGFYKSAIQ